MRNIYKAGETGLSILAFKEIKIILRNVGIRGAASVKTIIKEKIVMFGEIVEREIFESSEKDSIEVPV